jgi:hypothetical protein
MSAETLAEGADPGGAAGSLTKAAQPPESICLSWGGEKRGAKPLAGGASSGSVTKPATAGDLTVEFAQSVDAVFLGLGEQAGADAWDIGLMLFEGHGAPRGRSEAVWMGRS